MFPIWRRYLARFADGFIFYLLYILGVAFFTGTHWFLILSYWGFLIALGYLAYNIFMNYRYGQTFGKKILSLKLVDRSGKKPGFGQVLVREILITTQLICIYQMERILRIYLHLDQVSKNISVYISAVLILFNLAIVLPDKEHRMLHDILLRTK
ncbi:MAG TPA: RDD family protein, partial [Bacillota bacterium]|nr:RDD family protein [Bacillota bacterium]